MSMTLILNASAEPLSFVSVKRAVVLLLKDKAELVESDLDKRIRSAAAEVPYPLVIRLVRYVQIPRRFRGVVTNAILFARDQYTCQYCGRHRGELARREYLTREHVKPVSRGGANTWDNVVAACSTCNHKKADKMPYEVKMYPIKTPFEPRYIAIVLLGQSANSVQQRYIEPFAKKWATPKHMEGAASVG